jgi:hypothetical protein
MLKNKWVLISIIILFTFVVPAYAMGLNNNSLTAERVSSGAVVLSWSGGIENRTVKILRKESGAGAGYISIGEVAQTAGTYTDYLTDSGSGYDYTLSYEYADSFGQTQTTTTNATTVSASLPAAPSNNNISSGSITGTEGGMLEKAIAGVINGIVLIFQQLEQSLSLQTMDVLVFNRGLDEQDKEMAPFSAAEWDKLGIWYKGITIGVGPMVLIAILVTAVKFMKQGLNPESRSDAMESTWRWLLAIVLIAGAPILFWVMFNLNNGLVDTIQQVGSSVAMSVDTLNQIQPGQGKFITDINVKSALGAAMIKLMLCGLELYINMLYLIRKYTLMTIFVFTPFMAWLWAVNKNVNAMGIWFGELLSNAFMQTAHALVFMLFLTFVDTQGTGWFELVVWLMIIIPIAEVVRNSVQGLFTRLSGMDEGGMVSKAMGIFGLGAVVGMGRLASTAIPLEPITPSGGGSGPGPGGGGGISLSGTTVNNPSGGGPQTGGAAAGALSVAGGAVNQGNVVNQGNAVNMTGGAVPRNAVNQNSTTNIAGGAVPPPPATGNIANPGPGPGGVANSPQTPAATQKIDTARKADKAERVASTGMGLLAGTMFAAVPGGDKIVKSAQSIAGGAARAGVAGIDAVRERTQQNKEQGVFAGGDPSSLGGVNQTVAPPIEETAMGKGPAPGGRYTPSLDGYRWR